MYVCFLNKRNYLSDLVKFVWPDYGRKIYSGQMYLPGILKHTCNVVTIKNIDIFFPFSEWANHSHSVVPV